MTGNGTHHHWGPSDEQRAFFEALVAMRGRYATRAADDAMPVMNLHHAIASANAAMAHQATSPAPGFETRPN